MELLYYSYCMKPMEWEFFVPARTLIGVKLLNHNIINHHSAPAVEAAVAHRGKRPSPAAEVTVTRR